MAQATGLILATYSIFWRSSWPSRCCCSRVRASERRYRMLETVRQYAHDRLVEAGEIDGVRRTSFLVLLD